jgi:diguanylate cyclase (GGDEF)-like protein
MGLAPPALATGERVEDGDPMTSWTLWTNPRRVVAYVLGVELLTIALTVWTSLAGSVTQTDLTRFAAIVILGLLAAETAKHVERMRRHLADALHVNLTSVWTLAASLLTTASLAVATVVILYGHLWLRTWRRIPGRHPHRVVFSVSMVILSCIAARSVADLSPVGKGLADITPAGLAWLVLIIVMYSAVNTILVAIAIALEQDDHSLRTLLGSWNDNSIEFATLSMGALTAVLLSWKPIVVLFVLLPLQVLHRSVLVRQLEHAATTDEKTGLLNATTWQTLATNELHRAERHGAEFSVLLVDLDRFKWVNERFGHPVGDLVLRAVADTMRDEVRDIDLCGRFGGEEFVVLLPGAGLHEAVATGNRICTRIRDLPLVAMTDETDVEDPRLSASIGVATYPDAGRELDEILLAADNAMFAAKDSGRDQVRAVVASRAPERRSTTS